MKKIASAFIVLVALAALPAVAGQPVPLPAYPGFSMEVLVNGQPASQYAAYGVRYIEAFKGKEYSIRLRNPLGVRVAVALSVDGLNSIDARHTDARSARKWVLDPYQTITISGWQTSMNDARSFYFTNEEQSYGRALGKTQDLGIISAVFFRERVVRPVPLLDEPMASQDRRDKSQERAGAAGGAPAASPQSSANQSAAKREAEEYAATGMGQRVDHSVVGIHLDLEDTPAASFNVRYEYRAQLVRLGVFPPERPYADPLARRQGAQGFSGGFCPQPR